MKWREIAIYLYLNTVFNNKGRLNYYDLLYALRLISGRKNCRKIIRRLVKEGLLVKNGANYKIINVKEFVKKKVLPYIAYRMRRILRSLDPDTTVQVKDSIIVVYCTRKECVNLINRYLELIPSLRPHISLRESWP